MKIADDYDLLEGLWHLDAYAGELAYDDSGNIVNELVFSDEWLNAIVNVGKNLILDRLFALGGPPAAIGSVGVGTDPAVVATGQIQLNPAAAGTVLIKTADAGTSRTAQTVTIKATFGTGEANFNWNEAGLFNGNTNGTSTMLNRVVIGPFAKSSAVSIVLTITISQT